MFAILDSLLNLVKVLLIYSKFIYTIRSVKCTNGVVTIYHIQFSESEFKQYVGKVWDQNANKGMKKAKIPEMNSLPNSFDWREHGAVTEVKNQVRY